MKFLLMTGLMVAIFFACNDDDDEPPILAPTVSNIEPDSGPVGQAVTLTGLNFGSNPIVRFGDVTATTTNVTTTSITTSVPTGAPVGELQVTVENDGRSSGGIDFEVTEATTGGPTPSSNIPDTLATVDSLSSLVAAIEKAGLGDALAGDGPFTIFAPTNSAFAAFLDGANLADLEDEAVADVLRNHVVSGTAARAGDLQDGQTLTPLEADENEVIPVTIRNDSVLIGANEAYVVVADIATSNGIVHLVQSVVETQQVFSGDELAEAMREANNVVVDPSLGGIARQSGAGTLDPRANATDVTANLADYPDDDFFEEVTYKGAFDPSQSTTWLDGWTKLSRAGYLATADADAANGGAYDPANAIIVDVPQSISADVTWTAGNVYQIDGLTYVQDGATLTIEPGTVVVAKLQEDITTDDNTSALIVTRGSSINAAGTAADPIIFTSANDDGDLFETDAGQWGGLIVLGAAPIEDGGSTTAQIEGIDDDETRGNYGGSDAADNSGTLTYVSIRHSGVGINPGDEIQGLTLGGVGSGTVIDFVEIYVSGDDGIEFFGGTVNVKHAAVAFANDDAFDYDTGYRGFGQFWFTIQLGPIADNAGDHGGEWDGAIPDNASLYSDPTIYNATFIGRGRTDGARGADAPAILMRDNTAGVLANSIITDFDGKGIEVEDLAGQGDSYNRFLNGEIEILNNIWYVAPAYTEISVGESGIITK